MAEAVIVGIARLAFASHGEETLGRLYRAKKLTSVRGEGETCPL
jgi:hypothetical protein